MRVPALGLYVGAIALASALAVGATGLGAQASGRSAMAVGTVGTVGTVANGGGWGAVPQVGLTPPRGSNWGPEGYRGDILYPVTPAPLAAAAAAAPPPGNFYADDVVTARDGWDDRGPGNADTSARGYLRVGRGSVVPGYLRTSTYFVTDWRGYGLAQPGYGLRWVRYYDDALLIDANGRVQDTRYDVDWNRDGVRTTYVDEVFYEPDNYDRGFLPQGEAVDPGVQVYRSGADSPNVSVHRNPDGSTTVVVRNEPQVTTSTRYVPAAPPPPPPAPTYIARRR
ncbi:MAG: hypothetical protein JWL91_1681 [Sphingomonas bacterium]|nr:RcnB family protein [Sphingomonas bacterium]MDB5689805.1 hypothetical protein [Sphingomonas bacterium]